jgi:hypothetical protein
MAVQLLLHVKFHYYFHVINIIYFGHVWPSSGTIYFGVVALCFPLTEVKVKVVPVLN